MKFFIGANLKMNKNNLELEKYLKVLINNYKCDNKYELVIFPSFLGLPLVSTKIKNTALKLGTQNIHPEEKGEFTGEISANMLKDYNCEYVIVGHSERRKFFNETNSFINKKLLASIKNKLRPILCVGESIEEKEKGLAKKAIKKQIEECLLNVKDYTKLDISYEPIWAIGKGQSADKNHIIEVHSYIKKLTNNKTRVIYGGSVNPINCEELSKIKNVDGFLIGGAALIPENLIEINKKVVI